MTDNLRGALLMIAGMAAFVFNDGAMKHFGADIPLFQAIFVRGLFVCGFVGVFGHFSGAFRPWPDRGDILYTGLRALAELGATVCILTALFKIPLANLTAIMQSTSLVVTLAAIVLLGEHVGVRRGLAIATGFLGVLIIIRPSGDGFNAYSLLAVAAVFWVTARDLLVRRLTGHVSSLFVTFFTAAIITAVAGLVTLANGSWIQLSWYQVSGLGLTAVFLFAGYYCAVAAMRFGEMSFVTPFRYTAMLWAIALGWAVFGDFPDIWTTLGMVIIVGAGLYSLARDRTIPNRS